MISDSITFFARGNTAQMDNNSHALHHDQRCSWTSFLWDKFTVASWGFHWSVSTRRWSLPTCQWCYRRDRGPWSQNILCKLLLTPNRLRERFALSAYILSVWFLWLKSFFFCAGNCLLTSCDSFYSMLMSFYCCLSSIDMVNYHLHRSACRLREKWSSVMLSITI